MNGLLGFILFFTFIIYGECVDFAGHNGTNLGVTNKIMVKKCCPEGQHLLKDTMKCRVPNKQWRNQIFPNIPLYRYVENNVPVQTDKKFYDIYEIKTAPNQTFDPLTWNDYTATQHTLFLSDAAKLIHVVPNEYIWLLQININDFCVDLKLLGKTIPPKVIMVSHIENTDVDSNPLFITIGFLVSTFFLALVLVVYIILPELRNLSGLVLMAYVFSLLGAFFIMAVIRLNTYEPVVCRVLSTVTYLLFMSSFCWMNVMSMDIWWTFRGYAKARPIHRRGEMFKFCMYCQYGYGVPILLTIILTVMDLVDLRHKPWIVVPGIIKMGCFIGDDGKFFYLYVPMLILTMTNWVLFLMTAFNIWRLHRNTAVLDSAAAGTPAAHRTQRYRLLVYLKLSIIMGINWVLEVISSNYPNFKGWYITDAYNLLMGFFIFLIFVCKREILRKLIKRFKSDNEFQWRRNLWHSKSNKSASSAVSHTTDSEISQDTPLQVCIHPKGPAPNYISH